MPDLYANPNETVSRAIWEILGWWLVIFATWSGGLFLGFWIESGIRPPLRYLLDGFCLSFIMWLIRPAMLLGLGTSTLAGILPMRIESRKLKIGAVAVNLAVWTGLGAYLAWEWFRSAR